MNPKLVDFQSPTAGQFSVAVDSPGRVVDDRVGAVDGISAVLTSRAQLRARIYRVSVG
jgi:hypothetical protein